MTNAAGLERGVSLTSTLQRMLAVLDRIPPPADSALREELSHARAEAHMVLRAAVGNFPPDCVQSMRSVRGIPL